MRHHFNLELSMWPFSSKSETVKVKPDLRPPVGAMFEEIENDHERYVIVTQHLDLPDRDYEDSLRIEWFPSMTRSGMKTSLNYLNRQYKRFSPEKEKEWQEKYFANKEAFFAKQAIELDQKNLKDREQQASRHEAYYKEKAKALEKKIDTTKDKFIVIHSGSCDVLESLLNRAAKKSYKVIFTSHTEQHWFMAVLEKK